MTPALLDPPAVKLPSPAEAGRRLKRRGRARSNAERKHPGAHFNVGRSLPEPERIVAEAGNGGGHASTGAQVPYIPASRTLDLSTDRQADKFIKAVLRRRGELSEAARYMRRYGLYGKSFAPLPRMAGGAPNPGAESHQGVASNPATMAEAALPFDQASKRGIEPAASFTVTPGVGTQVIGPLPLPAQGFLRAVEIDVATTAAGTVGPGVNSADSPSNLLETIRLQDTNGNQLDDLPGYALLQDNIFGGYAGSPDPRVDPDFKATIGSASFQLQVVRELAPNGFGAIANLSASQAYKLTLRVAPESVFYATKPTVNSTFLISIWMHFWQLPEAISLDGRPQVQTPPFHGTTQYRWYAPANGVTQNVNLKIEQTGNEIRNIILIGRTAGGTRSNAVFPEPFQLRWDTEMLLIAGQRQLRKIARELTNDLTALDAGVLPLPFNFGEGRTVGGSGVNSWLPTVTGTRLQVTGTQEASTPGNIDVFVNDVSVAETNPAMRPVAHGPGGYSPQVAPRLAGAA